jgi:hypothetical protein
MKHIKQFNENNGDFGGNNRNPNYKPMKKFVLTTTSESSDHYIYFIENHETPTREELNKFLIENGNDVEDGYSYEGIDKCVEIKEFKRL